MAVKFFAVTDLTIDGNSYSAGTEVPPSPKVARYLASNLIVAIEDSTTKDKLALAEGRLYIAGAGHSLAADATGWWRMLNNSVDHLLYIVRIAAYADQALPVRFRKNPTTAGTIEDPFSLNQAVARAALGQLHAGIGVIDGELLSLQSRVSQHAPYILSGLTILVAPGQSFAMQITAPSGIAATAAVTGSVTWFEEPI